MARKKAAAQPQPPCPHCGGLHFGQRFDDCTFVRILADERSTPEQKRNAGQILRSNREESTEITEGRKLNSGRPALDRSPGSNRGLGGPDESRK